MHAKYTRSRLRKWIWTFLASVAFGFCAIWSMHFVGMLACRLDVTITFDGFLTVLSVLLAIFFTFAAFSCTYTTEAIELGFSNRSHSVRTSSSSSHRPSALDPEVGYETPNRIHRDEGRPKLSQVTGDGDVNGYGRREDDVRETAMEQSALLGRDHRRTPSPENIPSVEPAPRGRLRTSTFSLPSRARSMMFSTPKVSPEASSTDLNSNSRVVSTSDTSGHPSGVSLTPSSPWSLRVEMNQATRTSINPSVDKRAPHGHGWCGWVQGYYKTLTLLVTARAAICSIALALMHHCGMWAMHIPRGRITWNLGVVALSYIVAFAMFLVACVSMEEMEVNFGRQIAFSTIAALGCCSLHYIGMAAATFYTYSPPSPQAGYPAYLPFTIVGIAVLVCVISNVILANSAIVARSRMAEMALTKQRLWRIMTDKEAAERANELKQQFISIASHEIRTPLHTVNGYSDLLSRTNLTEDQALYVSSIQQACHAINVVAGNVLDFSKLDRDNLELPARPIPMQLQKMVEDLARITDVRGIQPGHPDVDVILSVSSDVPETVHLDENYVFRVLMNLLSNAQKYCGQGYICIDVSMATPDRVLIKVCDTGIGIPKGFRAALFEPFRQAGNTSPTRLRQGTGLGLSIVKHLVQRMSGVVDVESTEGEGSTFIVTLPIGDPRSPPAPPISKLQLRRLRVVYGHPRTQELYVSLWALNGYVVSTGVHETCVEDIVAGTDALWADVESIVQTPVLRELLSARTSRTFPVFIVHSNAGDLALLGPELAEAHNVVLVRRPVILHALTEKMAHPEAFMGAHIVGDTPKDNMPVAPPAAPTAVTKPKERHISSARDPVLVKPEVFSEGKERANVLLVEDNMINQRLGRRLLETLGYVVITANDGQQALDAVKATSFHSCLMDCQMPVLDGFAATRLIRELERNGTLPGRLPIMALTANVTPQSEEQCRQAGMDHFLPKPLKLGDLDMALQRHGRLLPQR
ncbi:histidine kinase [Amylocystis lapponica]|nr:histidine kinase [Amylocystis lapponica]